MTIVRVTSHRARDKLFALIGKQQGYFSWERRGEWRECPPSMLGPALQITGIKRAKWTDDLRKYRTYGIF